MSMCKGYQINKMMKNTGGLDDVKDMEKSQRLNSINNNMYLKHHMGLT